MIFCSLSSWEQKQIKCRFKSQFSHTIEPVRRDSRLTRSCLLSMGGDTATAEVHSRRFVTGSAFGCATWNWGWVLLHADNETNG